MSDKEFASEFAKRFKKGSKNRKALEHEIYEVMIHSDMEWSYMDMAKKIVSRIVGDE